MQMQRIRSDTIAIATAILMVICVSRCNSQNTNASDAYKRVEEYENKVCNNEPTCQLINQVPNKWTVLPVRNCMCDRDCGKYKDCCKDSIFYNKSQQMESSIFQCHPTEKVYMITTCPEDYSFPSIRYKCEASMYPLLGPIKKVFIPVTNEKKNITYGNEYCAICHNDYTYEMWNLSVACTEEFDENATTTSTTTTPGPFVDQYAIDLREAKKRVEYDAESKSFVSRYNDKKYKCSYVRIQPASVVPHLRACVPAVSSCSDINDKLQDLCLSYTAYVYDENWKMFKNVDCAQCNNVTKNITLCNSVIDDKISGSSLFSTNDKASG